VRVPSYFPAHPAVLSRILPSRTPPGRLPFAPPIFLTSGFPRTYEKPPLKKRSISAKKRSRTFIKTSRYPPKNVKKAPQMVTMLHQKPDPNPPQCAYYAKAARGRRWASLLVQPVPGLGEGARLPGVGLALQVAAYPGLYWAPSSRYRNGGLTGGYLTVWPFRCAGNWCRVSIGGSQ
jgi:hypothetical protein